MFSAKSSEVLLALVVLRHLQYKPLLAVKVCLLPLPRGTNTWTAESPMGATHLLGIFIFCWLPPHIKPDWISHSVCGNEKCPSQLGWDCYCSRLALVACAVEYSQDMHTHTGRKSHITQPTSDMHCSKGTGMGHTYASAPTCSPSEQSQVAFWGTPRKAEVLRLPNRFLQIPSDTLLGCFSCYLFPP